MRSNVATVESAGVTCVSGSGLSAHCLAPLLSLVALPVFVSVDDLWRMVAHVMPLASFDDRPNLEPSRERSDLQYSRGPLVGSLPLALSLPLGNHYTAISEMYKVLFTFFFTCFS